MGCSASVLKTFLCGFALLNFSSANSIVAKKQAFKISAERSLIGRVGELRSVP